MQKLAASVLAFAGVAQANYLSGEVRSQEWFTYGKFVAKIQNPDKMGTVQSFFTYTAQDWPHGWNEIDVELVPSVTENPFSMNIIWKDGAQDHDYATGFHPGTDWFTYTVEWTPDSVSWFVNDKLVRKSEGTEDVHFLDMPTQLMMNFWTPCWSPWNDYFDDAEMPWYAKYDYVEVYDYDQKSKDFTLRWRDDFNTFDAKKWYASDNWGFENNSSLFMSSQVYVEDGNLVLKMDYNDGHAREFPEHHQVVHHEKPVHEAPHHVEAHHAAKAPHKDAPHHEAPHKKAAAPHHEAKAVHHEAPHHAAPVHHEVPHHAAPVHHEAPHHAAPVHHEAPHHAAPVHHEAPHHEAAHVAAPVHHEAPHHESTHHRDIDAHKYEAPLVHEHRHYSEHSEETGYPHHYSESDYERIGHEFQQHHGYAETEHAETGHFKHGYHEGEHETRTYETVKYGQQHHSEHHEPEYAYHTYTAPAATHHETNPHHESYSEDAHHEAPHHEVSHDREYLRAEYPHHQDSHYATHEQREHVPTHGDFYPEHREQESHYYQ